jgi:uncharacterized protein YutE (UPF0331/DUF86 family)
LVDEEVIRLRLSRLEESLKKLSEIAGAPEGEYLSSWRLRDLAERNLEVAAQSCLDIGNHLISSRGLRAPQGYADVFRVLLDAGSVEAGLAGEMGKLAGLRNILVHEYLEVDHRLVHRRIQDLSPFRDFAAAIKKDLWG